MAFKYQIWDNLWRECSRYYFCHTRSYCIKINWYDLRTMIQQSTQNRSRSYPLNSTVGVAHDVLRARANVFQGVSILLKYFPVKACKFCPEVFIGENGHLIQQCCGYFRRAKNQEHEWIDGRLNDILVNVKAFDICNESQDRILHEHRSDSDYIPAVVELCSQAGAKIFDESLHFVETSDSNEPLELDQVALKTLKSWENLREGVQKLLWEYPSKVCKKCKEVHIGSLVDKTHLREEQDIHFWRRARVDDLVPPKVGWRRRPRDPAVLSDEGRDYYGHAPAVVELCFQAGALVPPKYHKIMKMEGLPPPSDRILVS